MQSQNPNAYKHYKRLTWWNANWCYSLRTKYLISETCQILFSTASLIFTAVKLFHEVIWELRFNRFVSIMVVVFKLWIYFMQVVAKCLHFVMSYKWTLESAQYRHAQMAMQCFIHVKVNFEKKIWFLPLRNFHLLHYSGMWQCYNILLSIFLSIICQVVA